MRHALLVLGTALACAGCVENVLLNPTIRPNAFVSHKMPASAAVVCSPGLLGFVERANPTSETGSLITYQIELGEILCGTLTRSVQLSYESATRPAHQPQRGQFGRIIRFELQSSELEIQVQDAGWAGTNNWVTYTISVSIEGYDDRMRLLNRSVISGSGVLSRPGTSTKTAVKEAVEQALQQLANNASNLLVAGLVEPRPVPPPPHQPVPASPQRQ